MDKNKWESLRGVKNEKHHNWKGDKAGISAIHKWLAANYGKAKYCVQNTNHRGKRFEWSNISELYKRDISDYEQLCPSCHRKKDFTQEHRMALVKAHRAKLNINFTKVQRYLHNELVDEFDSIAEAARSTSILKTSIQNNLARRSLLAGGFLWKYSL